MSHSDVVSLFQDRNFARLPEDPLCLNGEVDTPMCHRRISHFSGLPHMSRRGFASTPSGEAGMMLVFMY